MNPFDSRTMNPFKLSYDESIQLEINPVELYRLEKSVISSGSNHKLRSSSLEVCISLLGYNLKEPFGSHCQYSEKGLGI